MSTPTLMIWGEKDAALSIETAHASRKYVDDLQQEFLPEASHWVHQEFPDEVNQIMRDWITGHLWGRS